MYVIYSLLIHINLNSKHIPLFLIKISFDQMFIKLFFFYKKTILDLYYNNNVLMYYLYTFLSKFRLKIFILII